MKRPTITLITLCLASLLLAACLFVVPTPPAPSPGTQPTFPATPQGQAATAAPAATPAAKVPLKDALATLEPQDVWKNFYDLTQIPRPSHHEEQVRDFLVQFGKGLGLETIVDGAGNVLIRKPAAKGMEDRQGVILQAHMDMVAQPNDGTHDFLTDPIDAYVEGDWVAADGTTLGADDGIGVALAMAVLQSQTPPLGPIESLFTVNEEDGMDGALGLQPGLLQGATLINLDWETEGTLLISSAGGEYARIKMPYSEMNTPDGVQAYQVSVSGLTGGHSGADINLGRGHATKLLVRLLSAAAPKYGLRLAEITGGTAANAIPQEATALVTIPAAQADAFLKFVEEYQGIVRAELAAMEPNLAVGAAAAGLPPVVVAEDAQRTILDALYGTPQGVLRLSDVVPGLVETSTNMGIVQGANGELDVTCYPRSSVDTELDDVAQMIASVWDLGGIKVTFDGRYPGWKANPDSPILGLMKNVYHDLYGVDPDVESVHAGTECGVIQAAYPGMDAISLGPTLQNVHTPSERLEIATVKKLNDLLLETLKRIPEEEAKPAPSPAPTAVLTAAPTAAAGATLQPLSPGACAELAQATAAALGVGVTQGEAPMNDPVTGAPGTGCTITGTGTGEQFESPTAVVNTLGSMLADQGWTADPMLAASGPTTIDLGYRKGDQVCWAGAGWWPDDSANCPKDQPVTACSVTPEQQAYTVTLNCGAESR